MIYNSTAWTVETAGWKVAVDDDGVVTLLPADSDAALQFSHFRKQTGPITEKEIRDLAERDCESLAVRKIVCGDYHGFTTSLAQDELYTRRFYVYCGTSHLFITFNSPLSDSGYHDRVIDWILSSLKSKNA